MRSGCCAMRPPPEGFALERRRQGSRSAPFGSRIVPRVRSLATLPELNLLVAGFLLHLPWELWLTGIGTTGGSHLRTSGELPLALSLAALAHAGIGVLAFWFIAAGARTRRWILEADREAVLVFVLVSVVFTLIFESFVVGVVTRWEHPPLLPNFAAPGLALPSLLQTLVTPLLMLVVVRRQLRSPREE